MTVTWTLFSFPINKNPLNGKQKQKQALTKTKKQDKWSTTPTQKLQHFRHCNTMTGYQERGVQHWLNFTSGNSFCHLLSPTTMEIICCSMKTVLISSWCLQRAFSLQLSASLSGDLTDLCMYLFNTGWWSSWPARVCVWWHHWSCYGIRPFVPTARCSMLNQNLQPSVRHTNFLTRVSCGGSWDHLKCL